MKASSTSIRTGPKTSPQRTNTQRTRPNTQKSASTSTLTSSPTHLSFSLSRFLTLSNTNTNTNTTTATKETQNTANHSANHTPHSDSFEARTNQTTPQRRRWQRSDGQSQERMQILDQITHLREYEHTDKSASETESENETESDYRVNHIKSQLSQSQLSQSLLRNDSSHKDKEQPIEIKQCMALIQQVQQEVQQTQSVLRLALDILHNEATMAEAREKEMRKWQMQTKANMDKLLRYQQVQMRQVFTRLDALESRLNRSESPRPGQSLSPHNVQRHARALNESFLCTPPSATSPSASTSPSHSHSHSHPHSLSSSLVGNNPLRAQSLSQSLHTPVRHGKHGSAATSPSLAASFMAWNSPA